jgi:small-conductance mechanosensitive channel
LRNAAEKATPRSRLLILRAIPILRLLIYSVGGIATMMILVEPTFRNAIALIATISLALAFALKEYVSCVLAGIAVVLENTYQPGDWVEIDGVYGEVKSIDSRAVRLVTADDTEVIVPHSRLWSASIHNASSGNHSLLCVANFYLIQIAESSDFRMADTPIVVVILEKPWGTHYRVKAYVRESREQFKFMTDITVRGKQALRDANIESAQAPMAVNG